MNREIKFRAWKDGEMLHWNRHVKRAFKTLLGNSVLMQYTGLTDKNDREIYEGDFIKQKLISDKEKLFTVRFVEGSFVAESLEKMCLLENINGTTEVVGNKFQDPKLLEE